MRYMSVLNSCRPSHHAYRPQPVDQKSTSWLGKLIYENMMNLAKHYMLGAGFKALIDQNKIIIQQNELMLRALKEQP